MKRIAVAFCSAAFLFACNSQDKKEADSKTEETKVASATTSADVKKDEWVPIDTAAMNKAWMENMVPGEPHAMLAKSDGTWDTENTMWMSAGAPPEKGKGSCVNKMILGGRFQQTTFKSNMMGMPFEGVGVTGYDNMKKVYTSSWMDNMGTGIMMMEGTWDDATKSLNLKGKVPCVGGRELEMREVFRIIDDKTQVMEMYSPDLITGKEYKNMEIKYTRRG
jgi:hypothetical protein